MTRNILKYLKYFLKADAHGHREEQVVFRKEQYGQRFMGQG